MIEGFMRRTERQRTNTCRAISRFWPHNIHGTHRSFLIHYCNTDWDSGYRLSSGVFAVPRDNCELNQGESPQFATCLLLLLGGAFALTLRSSSHWPCREHDPVSKCPPMVTLTTPRSLNNGPPSMALPARRLQHHWTLPALSTEPSKTEDSYPVEDFGPWCSAGMEISVVYYCNCHMFVHIALDLVRSITHQSCLTYKAVLTNLLSIQSGTSTSLPIIVHDLKGSQFEWVGSAYSLSATAFMPLCGGLAQVCSERVYVVSSR